MNSTTTPATYPAPPIDYDGNWLDLDPAVLDGDRGQRDTTKPEDIEHDNTRRARQGLVALQAYKELVGGRDDAFYTLGDLLTDLRHLADVLDVDFDEALEYGAGHYNEEIRGEA